MIGWWRRRLRSDGRMQGHSMSRPYGRVSGMRKLPMKNEMNKDTLKNYSQTFETFMAQNESPEWFQDLQKKGMREVINQGFPASKSEEWRYTNLSEILGLRTRLAGPVFGLSQKELQFVNQLKHRIVFINGRFSQEHSTAGALPGVMFKNLNEAVCRSPKKMEALFQKEAPQSVFVNLNAAFVSEGACITIAPKTRLKEPLGLVYLQTDDNLNPEQVPFVNPYTFIFLGEMSKMTLLESYIGFQDKESFANAVTRVFVKEGAHLEHVKLHAESPRAHHISETQIRLRKDARLDHQCISTGSKLARNNLKVVLDGPGAHVEMNGLYTLSGTQTVDNHTTIDHREPHTTSRQLYKGLLDDASHAVFNGKVIIRKDAQKVEAEQLNRNLLLSDNARIDTKPELQIAADDVSCTHGATIGQMSEEEVFYLKSRGISEREARGLLVGGFVNEVVDLIGAVEVREMVKGATDRC